MSKGMGFMVEDKTGNQKKDLYLTKKGFNVLRMAEHTINSINFRKILAHRLEKNGIETV